MALLNLHFEFAAYLIKAGADVDKWTSTAGRRSTWRPTSARCDTADQGKRRDGGNPE